MLIVVHLDKYYDQCIHEVYGNIKVGNNKIRYDILYLQQTLLFQSYGNTTKHGPRNFLMPQVRSREKKKKQLSSVDLHVISKIRVHQILKYTKIKVYHICIYLTSSITFSYFRFTFFTAIYLGEQLGCGLVQGYMDFTSKKKTLAEFIRSWYKKKKSRISQDRFLTESRKSWRKTRK